MRGAVNAAGYPNWGINFDQDTLLWGTETNDVNSTGFAAGLFMHMARLIQPYNAFSQYGFAGARGCGL